MVLGYLDLYFCRMGLKITGSPCNVGLSNLVSQKASRSQSNTIVLCHHRRYYATANSRRPCDIFRLCIGLGMAMKSKVTTTVLNFWKVAWISNTFWYCALFRRNQFSPDQNCFERGVQTSDLWVAISVKGKNELASHSTLKIWTFPISWQSLCPIWYEHKMHNQLVHFRPIKKSIMMIFLNL